MRYVEFYDKVESNDFLTSDLQLHYYFHLFQVHPMCLCLFHLFICSLLIITLHWGMHLLGIHDCTFSFYYFTFLWPKGEGGTHRLPTLIDFFLYNALFLIIPLLDTNKDVPSYFDHFGLPHFHRDTLTLPIDIYEYWRYVLRLWDPKAYNFDQIK